MTDNQHATLYLLPDSAEIKTREEIIADYMVDHDQLDGLEGLGSPRQMAEQALEHAENRGLLVPVDCDADGCPNVATTLVSVGCPQPARYCDKHAAEDAETQAFWAESQRKYQAHRGGLPNPEPVRGSTDAMLHPLELSAAELRELVRRRREEITGTGFGATNNNDTRNLVISLATEALAAYDDGVTAVDR